MQWDQLLPTVITFLPTVGWLAVLAIPGRKAEAIKRTSLGFTIATFLASVCLVFHFDIHEHAMQCVWSTPWIGAFNVHYTTGVDGISLPLVLLTTLVTMVAMLASWNIAKHIKGYCMLFLLLETGMLGVFVSLDFFLFYVFWEVMLLPMYFLIGIWGGPRKEYAAIKFFLYTLAGSVLMLLAMIAFYYNVSDPVTGGHTFNMLHMMDQANHGGILDVSNIRFVIWIALFIGFAIKVPIFPFHTWLPDAHVEAPTAVSVILAGVLLKMGTYGILRISYPILPDQAVNFMIPLAILGAINILYGAFCAMAQSDMKKLVAYSSVSHMGYVLLGMAAMNSTGVNGAVFQMFNHGTITAMMFLCVGVIYDRAHHRDIDGFGGLGLQMPVYTTVFSFALFAAVGLPGLSGFVSEAMVFLGAFPVHRTIAIVSALGIVIGAAYVLWMLQRVFLGPKNDKYDGLPDISARELFTLVPIGLLVLLLGIYPMPVLDLMKASLNHLVKVVAG